jgi:type II secretory pathway pseudopilin PulG
VVTGRGHRGGFALVDAIVGAIIVGVSLAVIISLMGRALTSQKQGEEIATAAALADEMLHMVLARGPDDYGKRFPVEGPCEAPFEDYRFRLDFSGGGNEGGGWAPFRVTATITWGAAPAPQSLVVETLMASRLGGLDDVGGQADPDRRPEAGVTRTP